MCARARSDRTIGMLYCGQWHIHTYTHTYIHTHIHTHIHKYINTYTQAHIYTYINKYKVSCQFSLCKADYILSYIEKDANRNNNNNNNNKHAPCMSIDVAIPEDKNVIKKEAEKITVN